MDEPTVKVSPNGVSYLEVWHAGHRWVAPLGTEPPSELPPDPHGPPSSWMTRPADWQPWYL